MKVEDSAVCYEGILIVLSDVRRGEGSGGTVFVMSTAERRVCVVSFAVAMFWVTGWVFARRARFWRRSSTQIISATGQGTRWTDEPGQRTESRVDEFMAGGQTRQINFTT